MKKILVIGSINVDYSILTDSVPKDGETVLGNEYQLICGGKGANQAYAIGKMGGSVSMIGAIGNDENGINSLNNLKKVGVNIKGIRKIANATTGCAFVVVDSKGENRIIVISGANDKIDCKMIDNNINLIKECDIIVMQLEVPIDTVKYVINLGEKLNKIIVIDPAPAKVNVIDDVFDKIDFIKPNQTELSVLTGMPTNSEEEIIAAAKKLLKSGIKNILVTLGKDGTLLVSDECIKHFNAQKVKTIDSTAAGDAFLASFVLNYANGLNIEDSIINANKIASYVCTIKGAQTSIPNKKEVKQILNGGFDEK